MFFFPLYISWSLFCLVLSFFSHLNVIDRNIFLDYFSKYSMAKQIRNTSTFRIVFIRIRIFIIFVMMVDGGKSAWSWRRKFLFDSRRLCDRRRRGSSAWGTNRRTSFPLEIPNIHVSWMLWRSRYSWSRWRRKIVIYDVSKEMYFEISYFDVFCPNIGKVGSSGFWRRRPFNWTTSRWGSTN